MEIEEKEKPKSLIDYLVNVMSLVEEGSYSVAVDLVDWIIDQLQIHNVNPEIGMYEMPQFTKEEEETRE